MRRRLKGLVKRIERAGVFVRRLKGGVPPVAIEPYRGYGNSEAVTVRGRVVYRGEFSPPTPEDSGWTNFKRMFARWTTGGVSGARLEVQFGENTAETSTDFEGFFSVSVQVGNPHGGAGGDGWPNASIRLLDPPDGNPCDAEASVMIPPDSAVLGIVSDIDDTVVRTRANQLWRMVWTTLGGNVHTRTIFDGVNGLYADLAAGTDTAEGGDRASRSVPQGNPLFYVTTSPWNLHAFISDLFRLRRVPEGPIFMQHWGNRAKVEGAAAFPPDKGGVIRDLFHFYPDLRWILIGDSGQADPELYAELAREEPEKVVAIYIREVMESPRRGEQLLALRDELAEIEIDLILCQDSDEARSHARSIGLVP